MLCIQISVFRCSFQEYKILLVPPLPLSPSLPLPPSSPLPSPPPSLSLPSSFSLSFFLPLCSSPSSFPRPPQLTAVLVGDDPASHTYVSNKTRDAKKCKVDTQTILRDSSTSQEELLELVDSLNRDDKVHPIVAGSGPSILPSPSPSPPSLSHSLQL